jgi:hypothetical protein
MLAAATLRCGSLPNLRVGPQVVASGIVGGTVATAGSLYSYAMYNYPTIINSTLTYLSSPNAPRVISASLRAVTTVGGAVLSACWGR